MISGHKKFDNDSVKNLWKLTSGGRDVFARYLGKVYKGLYKRPWGADKHLSFSIWKNANDVWLWKDQATGECGDAITFVQRMFNLTYAQSVYKIKGDLSITSTTIEAERQEDVKLLAEAGSRKTVQISIRTKKFEKRHHKFWNSVGVSEDWCRKFNCYAVKDLAINHRKSTIGPYEAVFAYHAPEVDKLKIYFPDRDPGGRFRNNVPGDYIWRLSNTEKCEKLVVHKSMKDLITFSQLYPHNVATQSENIQIFSEPIVESLNSLSDDVWLFYGSDADGVQKSRAITSANNWQYINTPSKFLPEVNDVYSFVKKFGLEALEEFCKSKNLL